jgi:hypothetical protein
MLAILIVAMMFGFSVETSDNWETPEAPSQCDRVFYTEAQGVFDMKLYEHQLYAGDSELFMNCFISLTPVTER